MKQHQLATACIRIMGDTLIPEAWTAYFGVIPDLKSTGPKGSFLLKSSTGKDIYRRSGLWYYQSGIISNDLEPHILSIIAALRLPRSDIAHLLRAQGLEADIFCFWDNETGDRVPVVSDATMAMLDGCGIDLEIDEYPQPVLFCKDGECSEGWV